ncbi:MAG: L,D-transpeptidase family protein [Gammaproteobacteria bacterium]
MPLLVFKIGTTALLAGLFASAGIAQAYTLPLPPMYVDVIGEVQHTRVNTGDTLLDIARRHNLGQDEILLANPAVDRWLPAAGTEILLPQRYIIPNADRTGLILNVPEMRLYYFPKPGLGKLPVVITHPVSIGRMDWKTPLGNTQVVAKQINPAWFPPPSLKTEAKASGDALPDVVKPGPDNPLGRYAIRLGIPGYLIHSTNKPYGVGMRVTHGCVRMYPEDIETLFDEIPVGTPVQIINQPIKVGWLGGTLYLEVHPPLAEDGEKYGDIMQAALDTIADAISEKNTKYRVMLRDSVIKTAIEEQNGIPVAISSM